MVRSKRIAADADPPDAQPAWLPPTRFQLPADREHRWLRRLLGATPWIVGCMALFALYLRISFTGHVSSDGANSALQAWDMLHGHLLLHGWIIGDATYYTFDLPVLALTELFSGLSNLTSHVASALTYLIVTVMAVAIALAGQSRPRQGGALRRRGRRADRHVPRRVEHAVPAGGARPHRHLGVPPGLRLADRSGARPVVHVAAAARDPVRRPDRRRHCPLCGRACGRRGVRLSCGGRTERPHGRCRERPGRRRIRTAGLRGPRVDAALRRVPDGRPEDRALAAPAMAA